MRCSAREPLPSWPAPGSIRRGSAAPQRGPVSGKLAVVAGDLRVSYAEFDAAVNRAAHALAGRGLAKGTGWRC